MFIWHNKNKIKEMKPSVLLNFSILKRRYSGKTLKRSGIAALHANICLLTHEVGEILWIQHGGRQLSRLSKRFRDITFFDAAFKELETGVGFIVCLYSDKKAFKRKINIPKSCLACSCWSWILGITSLENRH